ncbi:hypothetical protein KC332_g14745 [Hortaea werneckii]|uniref:RCC1/BLIP-II n=1 Tax=Hortaea werneckii TaxID=91943 RepID=A0A3M7IY34_HORWE|nr:hypothetical protein KC358_g11633 [Hortaea werneckii]KAI6815453.1 hypothetical protein KC350_g11028 [Hortaea werneckii]KAI6902359.1 hypothetical protein KC348_g16119 [Hortaea werneckii]KAI6921438.1 hypothetical protein KC341_g15935 [Hortaea werneckii]KAI6962710.1 hypothetical protein KC321_g11619 [Hortaea werneckii]
MSEQNGSGPSQAGKKQQLLAAGFNAHGQLDASHNEDLQSFQPVQILPGEQDVDVFFAGWSQTVLASKSPTDSNGHGTNLCFLGFSGHDHDADTNGGKRHKALGLDCGIGELDGLKAYVEEDGSLYWLSRTTWTTSADDDHPKVGQIALAGNGRVALTFKTAPASTMCHVVEFETLEKATGWYSDPADKTKRPDKHHMLYGRLRQLLAAATTFLLLMEDGSVYSWGDPRHQSLGRPINGEEATAADSPGIIEALGGLKIDKIACGGWLNAALATEDGALYLWGAAAGPACEHAIKCLSEADPGEVVLVDLVSEEGEPTGDIDAPDVVDVGVGSAHVAAVTEAGHLYVVGANDTGQLGLGIDEAFSEDWQMVTGLRNIRRTICGPRSTFAFGNLLEACVGTKTAD